MGEQKKLQICTKCMYATTKKVVRYCEECGSELISVCPSCGKKVRGETVKYCFNCGHSLRPGLAADPPLDQR